MTQAIQFGALGGPEVLQHREVPDREPGEGEVLLEVAAVGLNRADSMYYHGQYFEQPVLPSGLGYEAVGTVAAVGPGGDETLVGRRMAIIPGFSINRYPVLATRAIVPADALATIPDDFTAAQGAAVWMAYSTAYGAIVALAKVSAGDVVLVTAASSSVGLAAIQVVKARGGVAIATTRTPAKRDRLLALGADHVVVTEDEDLAARVREISGGAGARIVFDAIGGDGMAALGSAVADGGTIFLYGMLSGAPTPYPMTAFGRRVALIGYTFLDLRGTPDWETMKRYVEDGLADATLRPEVARAFPFAQAADAYRFLESGEQVGKVVITV